MIWERFSESSAIGQRYGQAFASTLFTVIGSHCGVRDRELSAQGLKSPWALCKLEGGHAWRRLFAGKLAFTLTKAALRLVNGPWARGFSVWKTPVCRCAVITYYCEACEGRVWVSCCNRDVFRIEASLEPCGFGSAQGPSRQHASFGIGPQPNTPTRAFEPHSLPL